MWVLFEGGEAFLKVDAGGRSRLTHRWIGFPGGRISDELPGVALQQIVKVLPESS